MESYPQFYTIHYRYITYSCHSCRRRVIFVHLNAHYMGYHLSDLSYPALSRYGLPRLSHQEIVGADINWSSRQAKAAAKSAVTHITRASAERKPEEMGRRFLARENLGREKKAMET